MLIVNSMGMRMPSMTSGDGWMRIRRKLKSMAKVVRKPEPNTTVLSPLFLPMYGNGWTARLNRSFVSAQIRIVAAMVGPFTYRIVANPTAWPIAQNIGDGPIVFYRVDHFSATEDVDRARIEALEDQAFAEADSVFYASSALMRNERDRHHGKAILLEHGVDLSLFDASVQHDEPADLARIAHPRVVMMGSLEKSDRVAQTLEIAALVPELQMVIIGGGVGKITSSSLPNVHFLGQKAPVELPAYLAHVDVGLVVVARSEWGVAASPIKLKEYLAAGLPVVSSWFDGVEGFGDVVRFGTTVEEVAAAARTTAADQGPGTRADRLDWVRSQGWDAKAREMLSVLAAISAAKAAELS